MAENLVWLAKTYFPDRKIIVWAHTLHVMRNPQYTTPGRDRGFTMGHSVWQALGEESFVIGTTAYAGAFGCVLCTEGMDGFRQDVTADQHPSFEFEELMNAAGHELAWVSLRTARVAGSWLGGAFLARPVSSATERAPWSEVMDAVFFIRTQEPNRRVAEVRR
jgi:erythromycin esterase